MKRIFALLLALLVLAGCGAAAEPWKEQYDLGIRYLSEQNYSEAILAFTAAIEVDPNRPELYIGRARAYVASGETEENLAAALADYEKAKELGYTDADLWLGLADVYIRQGDYDKALEILEEGLEATGGDSDIQAKIDKMESGTITDSSGRQRKFVSYDSDGNLLQYTLFSYSETGAITEQITYDATDFPMCSSEYLVDENGVYITNQYFYMKQINADGTVTPIADPSGQTRRIETENSQRIEDYNADGNLISAKVTEYEDWNGMRREVSSTTYGPDGVTVESQTLYTYNDEGQKKECITTDSSGSVTAREIYEYGNDYYKITYEKNGAVTSYTIHQSDKSGKLISSTFYDADGNVTSVTKYQ